MQNHLMYVDEQIIEKPSNFNFRLHNHDDYEIYLFFEGDAKYIVEGNTYSLEPYDMIVIKKHEMHRVFHNSNKRYRRIVCNISPEFFRENNCTEYEQLFLNAGTGNKIDAKKVLSGGIYDAFSRLRKYSGNFSDISAPVVTGSVVEILHLVNNIQSLSGADSRNAQMEKIIGYINEHYTENISLDLLQKIFFVSKYHLCHIFRKNTGLTVHQYITRKRITFVRERVKVGENISSAAVAAGFNSYSSFYRAYVHEYGVSPKNKLGVTL